MYKSKLQAAVCSMLVAAGVASAQPQSKAVITADLANGKVVYMKYCFYCHGKEGRGDGAIAIAVKPKPVDFVRDVERMDRPDAELMKIIDNGAVQNPDSRLYMPAWKEVLSEQERWNVLGYIRELARKGREQDAGGAAAVVSTEKQQDAPSAPEGMVYIPEGDFIMGSATVDVEAMGLRFGSEPYYKNERPRRIISLKGYYADIYEVTNKDYKRFLDSIRGSVRIRLPTYWVNGQIPAGQENFPVYTVHWYAAMSYCRFLGKRLPTEAEWEKAARGTDGREFPWGNEYSIKKLNNQSDFAGPIAVGSYEDGKSPYGLYDMSGNVSEWVDAWYKPYPGGEDYKDPKYGEEYKVVRGGGWGGMGHYNLALYYTVSHREKGKPLEGYQDVGFRCVK